MIIKVGGGLEPLGPIGVYAYAVGLCRYNGYRVTDPIVNMVDTSINCHLAREKYP